MFIDVNLHAERITLQRRIDAIMQEVMASPKGDPDLCTLLADCWNGCDFATSCNELDEIAAELAPLFELEPVTLN